MFLTMCARFVALNCETSSFMLNYLIEKYLKKKLQGQQTPLDQAIIDCTRVWNTRTVVSDVCFFSGLLYGQLSFDWALPLLWTQCFLIYLMISTVQMVLVIKVIMIFKSHWISDYMDDQLGMIYRVSTISYASFWFGVDCLLAQPRPRLVLTLMTGSNEPK